MVEAKDLQYQNNLRFGHIWKQPIPKTKKRNFGVKGIVKW